MQRFKSYLSGRVQEEAPSSDHAASEQEHKQAVKEAKRAKKHRRAEKRQSGRDTKAQAATEKRERARRAKADAAARRVTGGALDNPHVSNPAHGPAGITVHQLTIHNAAGGSGFDLRRFLGARPSNADADRLQLPFGPQEHGQPASSPRDSTFPHGGSDEPGAGARDLQAQATEILYRMRSAMDPPQLTQHEPRVLREASAVCIQCWQGRTAHTSARERARSMVYIDGLPPDDLDRVMLCLRVFIDC